MCQSLVFCVSWWYLLMLYISGTEMTTEIGTIGGGVAAEAWIGMTATDIVEGTGTLVGGAGVAVVEAIMMMMIVGVTVDQLIGLPLC